jgi:hypothetical protein
MIGEVGADESGCAGDEDAHGGECSGKAGS